MPMESIGPRAAVPGDTSGAHRSRCRTRTLPARRDTSPIYLCLAVPRLSRESAPRKRCCGRIHDLRNTFASLLVSGGMSLPMIGPLLGHTQVQTTHRYAHLDDSSPGGSQPTWRNAEAKVPPDRRRALDHAQSRGEFRKLWGQIISAARAHGSDLVEPGQMER
jgi:hypothetical protein